MTKKFFITAAIPYVNAKPHIGHALEFVQTDATAQYHRLLKEEVLSLSGGDENALKNVQAAEKVGEPIQDFVDKNTQLFYELTEKLNAKFNIWQKGSNSRHHKSSQKLWELCEKSGDIYKKRYKGLYCVGCEAFYSPDELDESGECYEHPGKKLDEVEEENYFFRLSKHQDELTSLIETEQLEIVPDTRKNEILSFVKNGLQDISISRSNKRAKNWGVPVPGDPKQRQYVWFDALNIYQSGIGFGWDEEKYNKWWPADVHVIGKGIIRFHAVYWPAFLLSAKLKLPKKVFVHGYLTVDRQKMSKTLGNVYDPVPLLEKYGADPLRYYLLAKCSPFTDGDFSEDKFVEAYNSDLANGLGNLVSRISKLAEEYKLTLDTLSNGPSSQLWDKVGFELSQFRFDKALEIIWSMIRTTDKYVETERLWEGLEKAVKVEEAVRRIREIGYSLQPFLPQTAEKILDQFSGPKIKSAPPLFPRIS